jgi:hypothetical protein
MPTKIVVAGLVLAVAAAAPAAAKSMRSSVAFNTGIGQKTASQPAEGIQVAYQVTLEGGELDGCTVDITETLLPREEGAWGIFDIAGKAACADGSFSYVSSGSWDGKGFHAAGDLTGGDGRFAGFKGRIAQLGGAGAAAANGTTDISYELVVDPVEG